MRLLIFRHGPAAPREEYRGRPDAERPLTRQGEERTRAAARGLATWVEKVHVIATSPYLRAAQTAEILGDRFGIEPQTTDALLPGADPALLVEWLRELPHDSVVAVVGHEPDLGEAASWLLSGRTTSFTPLKKAGVIALDFPFEVRSAAASLAFAMTGGQLRRTGR